MHTCKQAEGLDDQEFAAGNMSRRDSVMHIIAKAKSLNVCKLCSVHDCVASSVFDMVYIQAAKDGADEENADAKNADAKNIEEEEGATLSRVKTLRIQRV